MPASQPELKKLEGVKVVIVWMIDILCSLSLLKQDYSHVLSLKFKNWRHSHARLNTRCCVLEMFGESEREVEAGPEEEAEQCGLAAALGVVVRHHREVGQVQPQQLLHQLQGLGVRNRGVVDPVFLPAKDRC